MLIEKNYSLCLVPFLYLSHFLQFAFCTGKVKVENILCIWERRFMLIPQQLKKIIGNTYLSLYLSGVYIFIYLWKFSSYI